MIQPSLSEQTLAELLTRIAQRDVDAMESFYRLTLQQVLRGLRRILRDPGQIEEASQDVYRHIWLKAATCDTTRYSVLAWLRTITQSRAIDTLRAHRRDRTATQPVWWAQSLISYEDSPEQLLIARKRSHDLTRRIKELQPEYIHLIHLAFFEGHSHQEISQLTATPLGTVKSRIRAALRQLRQSLTTSSRPLDGHELLLL